ncbi:hypothetical protein ACFQU2_05715 [Siccirubricoccus deserti]
MAHHGIPGDAAAPGLTLLGTLALSAVVWWATTGFALRQLSQEVEHDTGVLLQAGRLGGIASLAVSIDARIAADTNGTQYFLLAAPDGARLAGNLASAPRAPGWGGCGWSAAGRRRRPSCSASARRCPVAASWWWRGCRAGAAAGNAAARRRRLGRRRGDAARPRRRGADRAQRHPARRGDGCGARPRRGRRDRPPPAGARRRR